MPDELDGRSAPIWCLCARANGFLLRGDPIDGLSSNTIFGRFWTGRFRVAGDDPEAWIRARGPAGCRGIALRRIGEQGLEAVYATYRPMDLHLRGSWLVSAHDLERTIHLAWEHDGLTVVADGPPGPRPPRPAPGEAREQLRQALVDARAYTLAECPARVGPFDEALASLDDPARRIAPRCVFRPSIDTAEILPACAPLACFQLLSAASRSSLSGGYGGFFDGGWRDEREAWDVLAPLAAARATAIQAAIDGAAG